MNCDNYLVKCPTVIQKDRPVCVEVPGSKSITNRALLLAAMAEGKSVLRGCLTSEDARHFLECLKTLGFAVTETPSGSLNVDVEITGCGGSIPEKEAEIYVGSAGTAARFLVAMLAFSDGRYVVNSSEQMKKRPMMPLISSLREAGVEVECLEEEGHFPLRITGVRRQREGKEAYLPQRFYVNIDKSSQFLSALLIAAATLPGETAVLVSGSHGLSYVDLTVEMMKDFGAFVEKCTVDSESAQLCYRVSGGKLCALDYAVEPDMSAAAYFYALAAVLGVGISVSGIKKNMLQGDVAFLDVLEKMGCSLQETEKKDVEVWGGKAALKGGMTVDMSAFSDQALTLAAIAPFADGPVTITGIGHIRLQECDRIRAIAENLTALGIRVEEGQDWVKIYPGTPTGCEIETFEDHRVAMSFALTGLRTPGVIIRNPGCCKKTFAEYFQVLEKTVETLGA